MMWNMPWVWPEVGDPGTSGVGAVLLRLAQMIGQPKTIFFNLSLLLQDIKIQEQLQYHTLATLCFWRYITHFWTLQKLI